jgi:uncharacterized OB-fold protein
VIRREIVRNSRKIGGAERDERRSRISNRGLLTAVAEDSEPNPGNHEMPSETTNDRAVRDRVPLRDGLLSGPLSFLDDVRLAGSKCGTCGETSLGKATVCPNCGRNTVGEVSLSDRGVLWSFTVVRHKPPGDYRGAEPFAPFGLGLVELPEGLRVLSPIECAIDQLTIGLKLRFKPYVRRDSEREVVAFTFVPTSERGPRV